MGRVYSARAVLRPVPRDLRQALIKHIGLGDLGLPWETLGAREIEPIIEAVNRLGRRERDDTEAILHNIHDLACDTGMDALLEAADTLGDTTLTLDWPADGGPYTKATWACIHRPGVMKNALLIHRVDTLAWWRKRTDVPNTTPDTSPAARNRLRQLISATLVRLQGRGQVCTIDVFERGATTYVFAYPDDHVQNVPAHDAEGILAITAFRPTFLIVFAYDHEEGSLELFAKLPPKVKPRLEELFAEVVLGRVLDQWEPNIVYDLNPLLHRDFALATDPDDACQARVRRLRLVPIGTRRRVLLEADPEAEREDIYDMFEDYLNQHNLPLEAVNVTMATLTFEFEPLDGRKPGPMSFDIGHPNTCSLRNQHPERIDIVRKYLKRWGIERARIPATTPAALGV